MKRQARQGGEVGRHTHSCSGGSIKPATHPVATNAKVSVAQLDGLLGGDNRLELVPIVHLRR